MNIGGSLIPVFKMMRKEEHYDIIVMAIIDKLCRSLLQRNARHRRAYHLGLLHGGLLRVEGTYEGCLPDELSGTADELVRHIDATLTATIVDMKKEG